ncbi:hypothetical protein EV679_2248 [Kerstersia gyiorum]|jgi:hypothetical protein|uniref:Uncharacterized protein n=1 Tax=Kerstersia gyiorum TaxID=206506 RepID=A0A4Q7MMM3_9BURK|nr:hypothetical protein [Kerstersia gyiorum]MCP1636196.1 hypothetical protein [Kerstersia gyiorum]MCP1671237.1 hypothetical protein [Kerstersia gyiorum]MCP1679107.1 hypothetical protein [Kerstersia gyiorum]MCP1681908.1 hypothetical protein [Kerstersia gyiorum]
MDSFEFPLLLILAMAFMYSLIMAVIWVASRASNSATSTRLPDSCHSDKRRASRNVT